jgi:hypothetical protein
MDAPQNIGTDYLPVSGRCNRRPLWETPPLGFTSCNILADDGFPEFGPSMHDRRA